MFSRNQKNEPGKCQLSWNKSFTVENPYFYQAFPIVSLVVMRLYYRQSHLVVMLTRTFIIFLLIEASIDKR